MPGAEIPIFHLAELKGVLGLVGIKSSPGDRDLVVGVWRGRRYTSDSDVAVVPTVIAAVVPAVIPPVATGG